MSYDLFVDPSGNQHKIKDFGYQNGTSWVVGEQLPACPWGRHPETYSVKLTDTLYATVIENVLTEFNDHVYNYVAKQHHFNKDGRKLTYKDSKKDDFWGKVEAVLSNCDRVLLHGVPGTGKTTTAFLVDPERTDKITLTEETPASALLGHWIPEGDHFKWHHGIAVNAWLKGRRLLIDEVDRGSGDVQTLLYAIADDPQVAQLTLPTGEIVKPAPGFSCVLTMNGQPDDLPTALLDRFSTHMNIDRPHPKAIESLPNDLRDVALNSFAVVDGDRSASIRSWKAFADLREKVGEDIAAFGVFGRNASGFLDTIRLARG